MPVKIIDGIVHHPIQNVDKIAELYTKKDGVPVVYICTSAISDEAIAADIFYRETPHPEFGNRYFSIRYHDGIGLMIGSADKIEQAEFGMIRSDIGWEYSQHRHDYRVVQGVGAIDGGRSYTKLAFSCTKPETKYFKLLDGTFKPEEYDND